MKTKLYLNTFFIISIIGYLFELLFSFFEKIKKETLLIGPWMPIYGIGFLFIHFINIKINKLKLSKVKKLLLLFVISFILLSILEEIGGLLTNYLFHQDFWNYEKYPLSITKYVNLIFSFIFVTLAIIIEKFLFYRLKPFLLKIPYFITFILIFLFILDNVLLFLKYFLR